ncbi:substance-K receptor [Pituophis catenifer annectens]|uniref:substance-K receptor n=1 Tax=Pituophis catenifer annectens TaxID=94852 RepID=UPI0039919E97
MVSFSSINNTSKDRIFQNDVNLTEMTTFYQPGWQIALWAIAYLMIVTASIVGNATVIWIILSHRRMRTVTNYFIVNLALSDLLMSALNTVFNFIYACHNVWYFGEGFCRFHNFVPVTAMFVSIYSMTAVSAERYMAIIYPFKQKLSAANTKGIIGIIWLVACALAFPQFFYAQVITDHGLAKCAVSWPHNHSQRQQLTYHIAVILLVYVLPLTVMFFTYSAIGITLWHNDVPGDHINMVYYQHKIVAKKKFVRAMVAVVITFAVCWFPYHFYFILGSIWKEVNKRKYIQQVYLAVFLLAMSSAMYSPIIYCCLNHRFRSGFRIAFQWCPCVKATERDRLNLSYPDPYGKSKENKHPTSLRA